MASVWFRRTCHGAACWPTSSPSRWICWARRAFSTCSSSSSRGSTGGNGITSCIRTRRKRPLRLRLLRNRRRNRPSDGGACFCGNRPTRRPIPSNRPSIRAAVRSRVSAPSFTAAWSRRCGRRPSSRGIPSNRTPSPATSPHSSNVSHTERLCKYHYL